MCFRKGLQVKKYFYILSLPPGEQRDPSVKYEDWTKYYAIKTDNGNLEGDYSLR